MCGVGIEPRETPVFHAGDAAAAGDAQAAKTGDPSSQCCAHGFLLERGANPPRAPGVDAGILLIPFSVADSRKGLGPKTFFNVRSS